MVGLLGTAPYVSIHAAATMRLDSTVTLTSQRIVDIARSWDGTPCKHQGSCKGVGTDCKGFIWGVAREAGLPAAGEWYARVADYSVAVPVGLLREGLQACFDRVAKPEPGDVLLIEIGQPRKAQHLAIYLGWNGRRETMIHANPDVGRVMEVRMGSWHWARLNSVWRWRQEGARV